MRKLLAAGLVATALLTGCGGSEKGAAPDMSTPGTNAAGPTDPNATAGADAAGPSDPNAAASDTPPTTAEPTPAELAVRITFNRGDRTRATLSLDGLGRAAYVDDDTTFIVLADKTVTCIGAGRAQACTERSATPESTTATAGGFARYPRILELARSLPGTTTATEQIVGRAATCSTFDLAGLGVLGGTLVGAGGPTTGTGRMCTDDRTGALLQFTSDATARGPIDIVAVQVGRPESRDFEPPKPPVPAPTMPTFPALPGAGT